MPRSLPVASAESFSEAGELAHELGRVVRGEVRFDRGSRALYATDASNYRQVPIGLVVPRDADDVVAAMSACRRFGAPVLPRGAGTSLAGQCCNVAVVLDFSKYMNRILELDPAGRLARVEPGLVLDRLRDAAERHRLTFGPDPSTHSRCTLGGMIGNNSCGTHSLFAGKTVDNVEELRILLYDGTELVVGATPDATLEAIVRRGGRRGEIYDRLSHLRHRHAASIRTRYPDIPRRVSGYNLDQLLPENGFHLARALVGSEGTCAVVLEAKVTLIPSPEHRSLLALGYADTFRAADHVPDILPFLPIGLEGFEGAMIDGLKQKGAPHLDLLPDGRGFLLVEFGADQPGEAEDRARRLMEHLAASADRPTMRLYTKTEARAVWRIREAGPRAASFQPGHSPRWEGWDDAAVAPEKLGPYLRELRKLLDEFHYEAIYYGHFGHGCVHMQVSFDLESHEGVRRYGEFVERAADLVVGYGGSLSGEHGDGQARGALLPKMFGPELWGALREFKSIWDPDNKLNPHKLVDAHLPTEDLRLGPSFRLPRLDTHFQFPEDGGSFANASLRCIGIGECRKRDAGTMCPSYMATLEEEHGTRGRARMLFEALHGELRDGWRDTDVKEALDLCLSCKACKSECPTNVDIATYRSEFLAHYYEHEQRPLHAYAFGMIDRWAALGSLAPWAVNGLMGSRAVEPIIRKAFGLAPQRALPRLAARDFRGWARRHRIPLLGHGARPREDASNDVILWVDTFNNYFHPEASRAALDVLRAAGFRASIPGARLCCGRPLYDFGLLARAKQYLRRILEVLGHEIDRGVPIVVLEPSCASVFRDELTNLFPNDVRAQRLRRQTFVLSEFLEARAPDWQPPELGHNVLFVSHCHQKALMKTNHEESVLRKMGAGVSMPDVGCCGMAGPFGFLEDKYAVSQAIGERALLPFVRTLAPGTLIVADGFSCQQQIFHGTGRRAIHLAEAIRLALPSAPGR